MREHTQRRFSYMSDVMRYAAALEGIDKRTLPPVENWRPEKTGDIDIVIKADGTWFHEGAPINRAPLVHLFSTILRRDGDDYFLVTPVEKLKITVEDAPFIAVLMNTVGESERRKITFTTNLADDVSVDAGHPIIFHLSSINEKAPYIVVRGGLEARIARAAYYDLVALAERRQMKDGAVYGVWSGGEFFPLGPAEDGDP